MSHGLPPFTSTPARVKIARHSVSLTPGRCWVLERECWGKPCFSALSGILSKGFDAMKSLPQLIEIISLQRWTYIYHFSFKPTKIENTGFLPPISTKNPYFLPKTSPKNGTHRQKCARRTAQLNLYNVPLSNRSYQTVLITSSSPVEKIP